MGQRSPQKKKTKVDFAEAPYANEVALGTRSLNKSEHASAADFKIKSYFADVMTIDPLRSAC